jgi:predicted GIY-YIG superfamily endonuclease
MSYFVYILQSTKDGSYYIGSTQDIRRRTSIVANMDESSMEVIQQVSDR